MSHVIDSDRRLRRNNNTRYRDENKSNSLQFDRCICDKRERVKEKGGWLFYEWGGVRVEARGKTTMRQRERRYARGGQSQTELAIRE